MTLPAGTERPLLDEYDALLVDLDGVVHLGPDPVPGAAAALAVAAASVPVVFVTNNASRTPADVAAGLRGMGMAADPEQVITSAMAAAAVLADEVAAAAPVLVVGGEGLRQAVTDAGLVAVDSADDAPVAVIQGWGPQVTWADLAEACIALRYGARWVVTNDDRTLPSPRGPLPGSGSLVAALVTATDRRPDRVVGKPHPELFERAKRNCGGRRPLVVGDRLDTDIAGARAAGLDALLVLTGISRPLELLHAAPERRPQFVGADLAALGESQPPVELEAARARCRGTVVTAAGGVAGPVAAVDGLRAAAALAWSGGLDESRYAGVLRALGLK